MYFTYAGMVSKGLNAQDKWYMHNHMPPPTLNSERNTGNTVSACDSTPVPSFLSPSHSQPVLIDSVNSCVHYDLAGLMVTVFLHCGSIPLP